MATIKDVAERVGLSISTVSHAISGTKYVSEGLRGTLTRPWASFSMK